MPAVLREAFVSPWAHRLGLPCLCAAYLQGAFDKRRDFPGPRADRFCTLRKPARVKVANAWVENVGVAGAILLLDWHPLGGTHVS
ncbi:hypothetical protein [Roseateles sp.]|uniref:hypothetical protein n=1 Tax=Roseateles sp. TaxID=1971397 RepID=UPI003BAC1916